MYDVIVIGTGPAGLMTAIEASKTKKVLVLEKNSIPGKKLLITGGGRCNLTNLKSNREFLDEVEYNKKYLYSAINKFGPEEIYNFFTNSGVKLKVEEDNKVFPVSNRSSEIVYTLIDKLSKVQINYNENVIDVNLQDNLFEVYTNKDKYNSKYLVIATGGSSFTQTGSSGDNLIFANKLNQKVTPIFPAEVGIILNDDLSFLAGTSLEEVTVKASKINKTGNLIFTHKGLSGTSIMKISEFIYLNKNKEIYIDLLPSYSKEELVSLINSYEKEKELISFFSDFFSKKFSSYLLDKVNLNIKIKNLNNKLIDILINEIKNHKFSVKKVEDLEKAYVTGGGIDMNYIDTTKMESKINKGLYFVGEALDIHGPIGGYNITLALSTGYLAGISISNEKI